MGVALPCSVCCLWFRLRILVFVTCICCYSTCCADQERCQRELLMTLNARSLRACCCGSGVNCKPHSRNRLFVAHVVHTCNPRGFRACAPCYVCMCNASHAPHPGDHIHSHQRLCVMSVCDASGGGGTLSPACCAWPPYLLSIQQLVTGSRWQFFAQTRASRHQEALTHRLPRRHPPKSHIQLRRTQLALSEAQWQRTLTNTLMKAIHKQLSLIGFEFW